MFSLSTLVGLVWVFLVSIAAKGWLVSFRLDWAIFFVGIAYIVVVVLEKLGVLVFNLNVRRGNKPVVVE